MLQPQKSLSRIVSFALLVSMGILPPGLAAADSVSDLIDVPSSKWRTTPALRELMIRHTKDEPLRLTVHFTDVGKNFVRPLEKKLQILYKYSATKIEGAKKRLWGDIPYHFFIDAHGKVGEVRDAIYQPDSNTYYKRNGHITIVVEGDLKDGISRPQQKKLFLLLDALRDKYNIPLSRVGTHKQFAQTDCPGPEIERAVEDYINSRRSKNE